MKTVFAFAVLIFSVFSPFPDKGFSTGSDPVAAQIFSLVREGQAARAFTCRKERICGISVIPAFYRNRAYAPAWSLGGIPTPLARDLISALAASKDDGLSPEIYHFSEIHKLLSGFEGPEANTNVVDPVRLAELDILLTDAFLLYAAHLRAGRVDPESVHTAWAAFLPEVDLGRVLSEALTTGRIKESLAALTPSDAGYRRLKEALVDYRKIAAGAPRPRLSAGPALRPGKIDSRVPILETLLKFTGDLDARTENNPLRYDASLEQALRRFQVRHGLEADGILGRRTLSQLNRTPAERIRQIELNLERWRWLPHDLGARYILVNIADFRLDVMEAGHSALDMRVVVGTDYRKTPVFSETIKYLVLNPYWNVPFRIAVKDKLPLIQKDPSYLVKNGYRVFTGWEDSAKEVPPESIDWAEINRSNFVFRLRQDPGPRNALGRIKFMFPNRFSVYLHDTPQQALFDKTIRTFSSGCIRVEKPLELAAYVLQKNPDWTRERIEAMVATGEHRTIVLKNPIPVHLLYWTAWVTPDGTIHFRDDIYGRDFLLDRALREGPPDSGFPVGGAPLHQTEKK